MENEKDKKVPNAETAKGTAAPRIKWDDSNMRTSYANVCNVSSTREEVTMLFGRNQTSPVDSKEVNVQLNDRIILSPFAAKRLLLLLQNIVGQYEARFGSLNVVDRPSGQA